MTSQYHYSKTFKWSDMGFKIYQQAPNLTSFQSLPNTIETMIAMTCRTRCSCLSSEIKWDHLAYDGPSFGHSRIHVASSIRIHSFSFSLFSDRLLCPHSRINFHLLVWPYICLVQVCLFYLGIAL